MLANRLTIVSLKSRVSLVSGIGCACRVFLSGLVCWDDKKILESQVEDLQKIHSQEEIKELQWQRKKIFANIIFNIVLVAWAIFNFVSYLLLEPQWSAIICFIGSCIIGIGEIVCRCSIEKVQEVSPILSSV